MTCARTLFESSLSYAELSEFNIDQVVLTDKTKKETVTEKFENAMETQQRVVESVKNTDNRLMQNFLTISTDLITALNNTYETCLNTTLLSTRYQYPDILDKEDESPTEDIIQTESHAEDIDDMKEYMKISFWKTRDQLEAVRRSLLGYDDDGQFVALQIIQYCKRKGMNGNEDLSALCGQRPLPLESPNIICDDEVERYCFISSLQELVTSPDGVYDGDEGRARKTVQEELSRMDKYTETFEWTFAGQTLDPAIFVDHYSCKTKLEIYESQVLVDFLSVLDLIGTLNNVSNLQEAENILVAIDDKVTSKLAPYLLNNDTVIGWTLPQKPNSESAEEIYDSKKLKCDWYLDILENEIDDYIDTLGKASTSMRTYLSGARVGFEAIVKKLSDLINHYNEDLAQSVKAVQSYIDGDLTKKTLSLDFTHQDLTRSVSQISTMKADLKSLLTDFEEAYRELSTAIEVNYEKMFEKTFPFVTDSNKHKYPFLQKMLDWYTNLGGKNLTDQYLQREGELNHQPFPVNTTMTEYNIWLVVAESIKGFTGQEETGLDAFTIKIEKDIANQITILTSQYDLLIASMAVYSDAITMNTAFYM